MIATPALPSTARNEPARRAGADGRVALAASNNAAWCAAVCSAHGSHGRKTESVWLHPWQTPRFYPNAVTLDERPQQVMPALTEIFEVRDQAAWSVKDSFATLDLSVQGGRVLFDAEWLRSEPRLEEAPRRDWSVVSDEHTLALWEQAWQGASGGVAVSSHFRPALLDDLRASVITLGTEADSIQAGVIAYCAMGVVGLSNLFGPRAELSALYTEARHVAAQLYPGLAVVSYASGARLTAAREGGFRSVGGLRVWASDPQ